MRRAGEHSRRREQEIESPKERMHGASLRNRKEISVSKAGSSKLLLPRDHLVEISSLCELLSLRSNYSALCSTRAALNNGYTNEHG